MTANASASAPSSYRGVVTLGALAALVAATGTPDQETLDQLVGWGVPDMAARAGMYVAPVAAIVAAVMLGRIIARGRSTGVRWVIYALFGAVAGFFLGLCLDLFAGVPGLVERVSGPLSEPSALDVMLWVVAGFGAVMGAMLMVISLFGRPAMAALQVEETDPECLDVRRAERAVFGWSALGMVTLGVACAGLAVARQAGADERMAPIAIAFVGGLASAIASYVLWRGFDELQRRQVVNGYAVSAVIVTLGAFVWAGLETMGAAPALDATGVFLALIFIQIVTTMYVAAAVTGQKPMLGAHA